MILLFAQLALAEPTAIDSRGYWVADTVSQVHRSPRLLYPTAPKGYDIGLMLDYASNPLVEELPDGDEAIVKGMFSQHLYGGMSFSGIRLDASLPMASYAVDLGGPYSALGDMRLGAMMPLMDMKEGWPGMAVQAVAWLPTGNEQRWSGSQDPASGAVLSLAQDFSSSWGWSANAGARISSGYVVRNAQSGSGYMGGVEIHHSINPRMVVGFEAISQSTAGFSQVPIELGARMRMQPAQRSEQILTFGIAKGITDGVGSSAVRLEFGLSYAPRKKQVIEMKPVVVPVFLIQEEWEGPTETRLAELVSDQILIREPIFFAEGQSTILSGSETVLQDVYQVILENPDIDIIVEGHTNDRGGTRYNQNLSERRAKAVVKWLVDAGVEQNRLEHRGLGETYSIVETGNPEAMIYNRRVEFHVRPSLPEIDALPVELRGEVSAKKQRLDSKNDEVIEQTDEPSPTDENTSNTPQEEQ